MYILCTKDEYRGLIERCVKASKMKHGLVACKGCALGAVCLPSALGIKPGDILSEICVLVPPNEDAFVSINEGGEESVE